MHGREREGIGKDLTLYTVKTDFKKRNLIKLNMINFEQIHGRYRIYLSVLLQHHGNRHVN